MWHTFTYTRGAVSKLAADRPGVVLLVDDETDNLDVFRFNFEDDFGVRTASSGLEALEILAEGGIDVVVADHRMPGMSGLDLLEVVRDRHPHVGRMLLTAHTNEALLVESIGRRVLHHFVSKPWHYERMLGLLRAAVEQHRLALRAEALERKVADAAHFATLGEITAGLFHDLNPPVIVVETALVTADEILGQGLAGITEDLDELQACVAEARESASHLRRLATTAQSLMRRRPIRLEPVGLASVVEEAGLLMQSRLRRSRVHLTLRLPNGLPTVLADRVRVAQLILNLASNACDAMEDRPVRTLEVAIEPEVDGSQALVVSDTGPGIAAADLERIFDPFFTSKQATKGTGLGLSIVRRIADSHSARIEVRPRSTGGTAFRILFPPPAVVLAEVSRPAESCRRLTAPVPDPEPAAGADGGRWS